MKTEGATMSDTKNQAPSLDRIEEKLDAIGKGIEKALEEAKA